MASTLKRWGIGLGALVGAGGVYAAPLIIYSTAAAAMRANPDGRPRARSVEPIADLPHTSTGRSPSAPAGTATLTRHGSRGCPSVALELTLGGF